MVARESRYVAVALLVTFLWSSSYVLIKKGLDTMGPLSLGAYRYLIAAAILLAVASYKNKGELENPRSNIGKYALLGILGYALAQGLQVVGLYYLEAITVTFLLNLTPLFVLVIGIVALDERPTAHQVLGILVVLAGLLIFFNTPLQGSMLGISIILISGISWALYNVTTRHIVKQGDCCIMSFTAYPMAIGALCLFAAALIREGAYIPSLHDMGLLLWLSVLNTALAFFLWNYVLQKIEAYRLTLMQNTMLFQITLLAAVFLGEPVTPKKAIGIIVMALGVAMVQTLKGKKRF